MIFYNKFLVSRVEYYSMRINTSYNSYSFGYIDIWCSTRKGIPYINNFFYSFNRNQKPLKISILKSITWWLAIGPGLFINTSKLSSKYWSILNPFISAITPNYWFNDALFLSIKIVNIPLFLSSTYKYCPYYPPIARS